MLTQQAILDIFSKANAIITDDHFVYAKKETGWFHGSDYVNKDAIYPYTRFVKYLCAEIANHFRHVELKIVVGPTVGAVILSQWTAFWLDKRHFQTEVLSIYADEEDIFEQREVVLNSGGGEFLANGFVKIRGEPDFLGHFGSQIEVMFPAKTGTRRVIKRGYDKYVKGAKCLILDDIINSGITVSKTRDAVIQAGGEVVGVGALCNRSGGKVTAETLRVPELFSLLDINMMMYPEDECPICKERGPKSVRTDLGYGQEFLARTGL
ncbi:MAG: hypothetical protein HY005_02785 [Candidatus Staskawiczbacteria bacterium]|nr:hypothetical protein [Candidatus Staskawiczbacteria bacterium]MBI3337523.1 hypothetical protein [Candidatus Staskawiczbacteria bacterium]